MLDLLSLKNETASSGIPEDTRHRSDSDIIRPEYRRPSRFFGVRAGTCIRQNTVGKFKPYDEIKIEIQ